MELTKLSFGFTVEDMVLIEQIKAHLAPIHGNVSNVVAIRTALRALATQIAAKSTVAA